MKLDREKLKALVHYIVHRCEDPRRLGAVKLNKILWFSDMTHYVKAGEPITGESYVKLQYGPASKHVGEVLAELQEAGSILVREPEFERAPRQYIALTKPPLEEFTPMEIDLVNRVLEYICENHTASSISELTHDELWEMAETGEEIPYEAFLAYQLRGDVTAADIAWAHREFAGGSAG